MVAVLLLFVNCEKPNKCQAEIDEVNRLEKRKVEIVGEFRNALPSAMAGIEEIWWEGFRDIFTHDETFKNGTTDDSIAALRYMFLVDIDHPEFPNENKEAARTVIRWADSNAVYIPLIKTAKLAEEDCKKQ